MSYTNKTEFYEIPLPIETDLYDPMDYNTSMESVDTALHGAVQNASTAVSTANSASDAAAAATSGLEALSETVNTEKGKLTALTARVTAAENEIDDVRSDDEDIICAYNEPSATSAHAYAVGDFFIYNNVLYKATDAIAIGDTIVPNTNCAATNVTTEVDAINTALSEKVITVTADGVKTCATLLNEIAGAVNALTTEQFENSHFIIDVGTEQGVMCPYSNIIGVSNGYTACNVGATSAINRVTFESNASTYKALGFNNDGTGFAVTDIGATVPTSGITYSVHYR